MEQDAEQQQWLRSGSYATAVDSDSALLQLTDSMETKIPIDADHSQMVKFDTRQAFGYQSVTNVLKEFESAASKVVQARFTA